MAAPLTGERSGVFPLVWHRAHALVLAAQGRNVRRMRIFTRGSERFTVSGMWGRGYEWKSTRPLKRAAPPCVTSRTGKGGGLFLVVWDHASAVVEPAEAGGAGLRGRAVRCVRSRRSASAA